MTSLLFFQYVSLAIDSFHQLRGRAPLNPVLRPTIFAKSEGTADEGIGSPQRRIFDLRESLPGNKDIFGIGLSVLLNASQKETPVDIGNLHHGIERGLNRR